MIADVQRELAEAVGPVIGWPSTTDAVVAALLPTVQALIADAKRRAVTAALMRLGTAARVMWDSTYPVQAVPLSALLDAAALEVPGPAAALDSAGAASGEHRPTEIGNAMGGYDCACGEPWLTTSCSASP